MASNISEKIASTQIVYSRHNVAHFIVENQTMKKMTFFDYEKIRTQTNSSLSIY